jgi:hypothetical protein
VHWGAGMNRLLVLLFMLASVPALAADRWFDEAAAPRALSWHFSLVAALGAGPDATFAPGTVVPAASLELAIGRDLSECWSLDGVLGVFVSPEGGGATVGLRPLYSLSPHFDLGAVLERSLKGFFDSEGAFIAGPHFGFRAGAFYAFYEPVVIAAPGSDQNPLDYHYKGSGAALLPLRFGLGVRF